MFLFEHLALGAVALALGLAAAEALEPFFQADNADLLATTPVSIYAPRLFLAIFAGVELLVALFTLLPAWRGGRIATVLAIRSGFARVHSKPSLPARVAARFHLPPVLVLGLKDLFARPLRAP